MTVLVFELYGDLQPFGYEDVIAVIEECEEEVVAVIGKEWREEIDIVLKVLGGEGEGMGYEVKASACGELLILVREEVFEAVEIGNM